MSCTKTVPKTWDFVSICFSRKNLTTRYYFERRKESNEEFAQSQNRIKKTWSSGSIMHAYYLHIKCEFYTTIVVILLLFELDHSPHRTMNVFPIFLLLYRSQEERIFFCTKYVKSCMKTLRYISVMYDPSKPTISDFPFMTNPVLAFSCGWECPAQKYHHTSIIT